MPEAERNWTMREVAEHASRAVGMIDTYGVRGATLVSVEQISAMAVLLVTLGLVATHPGETPPDVLFGEPMEIKE